MAEYIDFNLRTNYDTFSYKGKRIILYEDHRCILNVLYYAKLNKLIEKVPNLIYFDYHDDSITPHPEQIEIINKFIKKSPSFEEFMNFVEFKTRILDDDWLITGMEMGLINHSINIGGVAMYNKDSFEDNIYKDKNGNEHELYYISHLDSALSDRGCICDHVIKENYYKRVREIFQFNEKNDQTFNSENVYPFVLDFDLDCFSCEVVDSLMAWPEKTFVDKYVNRFGYHGISPNFFVTQLIHRCEVITICREHNSCGGIGESNKILNYLDKYFFDGYLNSSPSA